MNNLPGLKLVETLDSLLTKLENSGVQRTVGLRDRMGTDCDYFKKSLYLFIKLDYEEIRNLIQSCYDLIQEIEQQNSGE